MFKIFSLQNEGLLFKKLHFSFYLLHERYKKVAFLNLEACSTLGQKRKFSIAQTRRIKPLLLLSVHSEKLSCMLN